MKCCECASNPQDMIFDEGKEQIFTKGYAYMNISLTIIYSIKKRGEYMTKIGIEHRTMFVFSAFALKGLMIILNC